MTCCGGVCASEGMAEMSCALFRSARYTRIFDGTRPVDQARSITRRRLLPIDIISETPLILKAPAGVAGYGTGSSLYAYAAVCFLVLRSKRKIRINAVESPRPAFGPSS